MDGRLDNFTDAAFAFAVTLLIIGGGSSIGDSDALLVALGDLPAFAFGFAIITMFWIAHVRWRAMRGAGDFIGVALTLLLVFLILIYVQPLRAMSATAALFAEALRGDLSKKQRAHARGDRTIWLILAVTGLMSIAVSFTSFGELAAMVYASLPLSIGFYSWRHDWDGTTVT